MKAAIREKLAAGGVVSGLWRPSFSRQAFARSQAMRAQFVIFDMERGAVGIDVLKAQIAFARGTAVAPLVRVSGIAYRIRRTRARRRAMGIMAPMVETREQAENRGSWCRYRPEGVRGLGFGVGHDDYRSGDVIATMQRENERTLVMP